MSRVETQPISQEEPKNDPQFIGALIGGAASLIGGALSSKSAKKRQEQQNAHNDPAQIRARYEAAGFNPLLGIQNANPNQVTLPATPQFGHLISNAITAYQNNRIDQQHLELEKTRLEQEIELQKQHLDKQTIRPKSVGGYAGGQKPSIGTPAVPSGNEEAPIVQAYNHIAGSLRGFFSTDPPPTVDNPDDDPVGGRFVESLNNVTETKNVLDLVHGRVGPLIFSTMDEEAAEMFEPFDGVIRSGIAAASIPVHAGRTANLARQEAKKRQPTKAKVKQKEKDAHEKFLKRHYKAQQIKWPNQ